MLFAVSLIRAQYHIHTSTCILVLGNNHLTSLIQLLFIHFYGGVQQIFPFQYQYHLSKKEDKYFLISTYMSFRCFIGIYFQTVRLITLCQSLGTYSNSFRIQSSSKAIKVNLKLERSITKLCNPRTMKTTVQQGKKHILFPFQSLPLFYKCRDYTLRL